MTSTHCKMIDNNITKSGELKKQLLIKIVPTI